MDPDKKQEIIRKAFAKACKFLREHPPYDTCESVELAYLVVNGSSDPDGVRWMKYFINEVLEEEIG